MPVELREGSADAQYSADDSTKEEAYEDEDESEDEDKSEDEDEECEDDGITGGLTLEQRFSVSNESLSCFDEMYDSELEVDYEN